MYYDVYAGRVLGAAADGGMHNGRGQAVPVRVLAYHQGQAGADPSLAAGGRGLRAGHVEPPCAGAPSHGVRGRRAPPAQGARAGTHHGPAVRGRVLRRHRHGSRPQVSQGGGPGGLHQPAVLHRRHLGQVRPAAAR